jgi:hypothetical protein
MSKTVSGPDEISDLEAARLAGKIRRLMLISAVTTAVAIGAVFAVIGYRVFKAEGSAPAPATATDFTITLPQGARVVSTAFSERRIAVTLEIAGKTEVRLYDAKTLQPAGRLRFTTEP